MPEDPLDTKLMRRAIVAARASIMRGGGPFAAIVATPDGYVLAVRANETVRRNDPTAHAELMAIRAACHRRGAFHLRGLVLVATCAPCVMCTGAILWARPRRVVAGARMADAAALGFDEGTQGINVASLLRRRGISYRADVEREAVVALLRSYRGPVYNG